MEQYEAGCQHKFVGVGINPEFYRCIHCGSVLIPENKSYDTGGIISELRDIEMEYGVCGEAADVIERLIGEIGKIKRDAERYQYLRRNTDWLDWDVVVQAPAVDPVDPQWDDEGLKLDNAIDFVMGNFALEDSSFTSRK